MFGRHARLPVDFISPGLISEKEQQTKYEDSWVQKHHERFIKAFHLANTNLDTAGERQSQMYNRNDCATNLIRGDRVLIRNRNVRGKRKVTEIWESQLYLILRQKNIDLPVYVLVPETGQGKEKIRHRNEMKPCPFPFRTKEDKKETVSNEEINQTPTQKVTSTPKGIVVYEPV